VQVLVGIIDRPDIHHGRCPLMTRPDPPPPSSLADRMRIRLNRPPRMPLAAVPLGWPKGTATPAPAAPAGQGRPRKRRRRSAARGWPGSCRSSSGRCAMRDGDARALRLLSARLVRDLARLVAVRRAAGDDDAAIRELLGGVLHDHRHEVSPAAYRIARGLIP